MSKKPDYFVRFWGVRGSYPTPGERTLRYGGNTTCVEVRAGTHTIILDAGSGIIGLGEELKRRAKDEDLDLSLLITHGHNDHLIGLPFFAPLFDAHTNIHIFGPLLAGQSIEQVVTIPMSPPYFPVDMRKLPSHRTFHTLSDNERILWQYGERDPHIASSLEDANDAEVCVTTTHSKSHPVDGAVIYRIAYARRTVVFATDVEWGDQYDAEFIEFVRGADLLIHDAQYTTDDYHKTKKGFGHSTLEMATEMASRAQIGNLILFHHEPTYDDAKLDSIVAEAQKHFAHTRSAYEGMKIDLFQERNK